ncbi:hypothetical protein Lupro_05235 [Lutibacter profundi]|uniref:DUF2249 domain-containing protein n=1 Tax=Lutibacter profundi TaxID=1622118 RepID=A0A0X8G5X9_9FLAO|nr:DUF2249 domain-containing protein [Lutibacter profundi]AMC10682.1 hypothetical protein Lupro_05235 [Lutibacter profundi]
MTKNLNTNLVSLEVRPIIEGGNDPFNEIMVAIKNLKLEETLQIINSFEPIPLINKLEKQGFKTWTERPEVGVVHTFFKKENNVEYKKNVNLEGVDLGENFDEKLHFFEGKIKTIDVRQLEMPEPMTTILQEIELLPQGHALFVEHKKAPQFLLPELKARGFEILYRKQSENHLQLIIFRN